MRTTINKIKWCALAVSALSLLMVFWVWPAWNSGSQNWYLGNDSITGSPGVTLGNTMYRNQYPPTGHDEDFVFDASFEQYFFANEAAMMMLNFGTTNWQYYLEVYRETGGMTTPGSDGVKDLNYTVNIGRWKNSMFESFFTDMSMVNTEGSSMADPVMISGSAMNLGRSLNFEMGDMLAAMLTLERAAMVSGQYHLVLKNTCYITSPLSDPGYPGSPVIPTLSQWGMLLFAALIAVFSVFVLRRRVRMGRP
jgi:hypothetical protein